MPVDRLHWEASSRSWSLVPLGLLGLALAISSVLALTYSTSNTVRALSAVALTGGLWTLGSAMYAGFRPRTWFFSATSEVVEWGWANRKHFHVELSEVCRMRFLVDAHSVEAVDFELKSGDVQRCQLSRTHLDTYYRFASEHFHGSITRE